MAYSYPELAGATPTTSLQVTTSNRVTAALGRAILLASQEASIKQGVAGEGPNAFYADAYTVQLMNLRASPYYRGALPTDALLGEGY